jgi:stress response protein SCP2
VATFDPRVPVALDLGQVVHLERPSFNVGLRWDVSGGRQGKGAAAADASTGRLIDLDAAAVVFDSHGNLLEAIYFG